MARLPNSLRQEELFERIFDVPYLNATYHQNRCAWIDADPTIWECAACSRHTNQEVVMNHHSFPSTTVRAVLDTYLQENLVPLLHDTITQDVLPSILHALQSSSTVTVTQSPIPACAMEPTIGTGRRVPVQSEGDPALNNSQHSIRFLTQPSSSPFGPAVSQTTEMPSSSPLCLALSPSTSLHLALSSSSSPAIPATPICQKRSLIQESSSQLNGRDGPIQSPKCIRLVTSYLDAMDLYVKEEHCGKSLAAASSLQAEDLLFDDDQDPCSFCKEAYSSQPDDLITPGRQSPVLPEEITGVPSLRKILLIAGWLSNHPSKFSFGLHPNQINALDAFVVCIDQNDHSEDLNLGSDGDAMMKLHEFLWTLMDGASVHAEENWANVIQRFIWFKALRCDGNFYESKDFTPDLAKLKYFVNGTWLIHALWYQKDSDVPQFQSVVPLPSSLMLC
ncbi:hypothetical protein BDR03DRAFT_1017050 [Suillus americanus]|nr:hypothetical protein BDR03DRAFT_1017050 [Suillus americanus]